MDLDNEDASEAGFGIILSDSLIAFLAITLTLFTLIMLMPHEKKSTAGGTQLGIICVELSWPNDRDIDLDLWGHSPGDPGTVGYTRKNGPHLNLYRDVIGYSGNPTHQMIEVQCADQLVPGEWTFNVHYFSNHEAWVYEQHHVEANDPRMKVKATMVVRIRERDSGLYKNTFMTTFDMTYEKQEKTLFDFVINSNGDIITDSVNSRDIPLKRGWKVE